MNIQKFIFNVFGENTYLIWNDKAAAVIDPGMMNEQENNTFDQFVTNRQLHLDHLLNTHMHIDHIAGDLHIMRKYGLTAECNPADDFMAHNAISMAQMLGFPYTDDNITKTKAIDEGSQLYIGDEQIIVLNVPGHSPGHLAFYLPDDKILFSGDTLFHLGIGRTDFAGGSMKLLLHSIETKIFTLPDDTTIYPGHGNATTVGFEKQNNPYF